MNTRSKVLSFLRNIFFAYLLTAILLLGLAFLLYRLHLNENQVNMWIMFIYPLTGTPENQSSFSTQMISLK